MTDSVLYKVITDIIEFSSCRFTYSDIQELVSIIKDLDVLQKLSEYLLQYILEHTDSPYIMWDLQKFADILNGILENHQIDKIKLNDIKNTHIKEYNAMRTKEYETEKNKYIVLIAQKNIEKDTRIQAIEHIQLSLTFYYTSENINKVEKLKSEVIERDKSIIYLKNKIAQINIPLYNEKIINTLNL